MSAASVTLNCDFYHLYFTNEKLYACRVQNPDSFRNASVEINKIEGMHLESKTNDDVREFSTSPWTNFKFLPKNLGKIFKHLTMIEIAFSKIAEIHQSDLKDFKKLQYLNLEFNFLEIIEAHLFKFNTDLETIKLGNNKISHIDSRVFSHLDKLNELRLNDNKCESTFDNAFGEAVKEVVRKIENGECIKSIINEITTEYSMNDTSVAETSLLCNFHTNQYWQSYTCKVQNNNIFGPWPILVASIRGEHEEGMTIDNITMLEIKSIPILTFIPRNIGSLLNFLTILKIVNSNLTEIHQDDLKQFPRLIFLDLSFNQLKTIEADLFKFNPNLESIYLNNNKISHIHSHVFSYLNKLESLSLEFNECNEEIIYTYEIQPIEEIVKQIEVGKCSQNQ